MSQGRGNKKMYGVVISSNNKRGMDFKILLLWKKRITSCLWKNFASFYESTNLFKETSMTLVRSVKRKAALIYKSVSDDFIIYLDVGTKCKSRTLHLKKCYRMMSKQYHKKWFISSDDSMVFESPGKIRERIILMYKIVCYPDYFVGRTPQISPLEAKGQHIRGSRSLLGIGRFLRASCINYDMNIL